MMLDMLSGVFPEFRRRFLQCHFIHDDGTYTHHGLIAEFSHFVQDRWQSLTDSELKALFDVFEPIVKADNRPVDDNIPDAIGSCFLENLGGINADMSRRLRTFMGPATSEWYGNWDTFEQAGKP